MLRSINRIYERLYLKIYTRLSCIRTSFCFTIKGVKRNRFVSLGIPILDIHSNSKCEFGSDLILVNKAKFSMLGKSNRCKIVVGDGGSLLIGDKVGISNTTIIATLSIIIGSNILIGGGTTIVDTDFHSLNPAHWHTSADYENMKSSPVVIKDNVFIGMNVIILKGVTIGANVIIAAGSVVSRDIPDNQIWGGNPAKFIKEK